MKRYFKRSLATVLALLLVIGLFTICGFGTLAENGELTAGDTVAEWDHKDLLDTTDRSQINVTKYDDSQKDLVGVELNAGTAAFDCMNTFTTSQNITLAESHVIRLVWKVWAPAGVHSNGIYARIYPSPISGSTKIVDAGVGKAAYDNAQTKIDETYGYQYKEVTMDVTISAATAEATKNGAKINQWFNMGGADYAKTPLRFYGFAAYDTSDNNKLVYEVTGEQLANLGLNTNKIESNGLAKTDLYASSACHTDTVGITTVDNGTNAATSAYMKFDSFIPAATANAGDEIEIGIEFWAENGLTDTEKLSLQYQVRDKDNKTTNFGTPALNGAGYDALEAQYDDTYGYAYKTFTGTFALSEEVAAVLQSDGAKGFNMMIGSGKADRDWKNYPVTVYRYYIYNKTQKVYYADYAGGKLLNYGGNGTQNALVTATAGKVEYALDSYVQPGQSLVFDTLNAAVPVVGNYSMNFAVTGTAGKEYTLTALTAAGDELAATTITATGEAQTVEISFDQRNAGETVTFAIATGDAPLTVDTVSFVYNGDIALPEAGDTVAAWNHSDLLAASSRSQTDTTGYSESEEIVIGTELNAGSSNFNSMHPVSVSGVTLVEGHTIRFVEKMYCPNGIAGTGPFFRIYATGSKKIADLGLGTQAYDDADTVQDETYGYYYKETVYEVLVSTADHGTDGYCAAYENTTLSHWFFVSGVTDMSENPLQFYGFEAYDLDTGELLYEITGAQIAAAGLNPDRVEEKGVAKTDLYATVGSPENALDCYVRAGASVRFRELNAAAPLVGSYSLNYTLTGTTGDEYTVTAYTLSGNSITRIGSYTATATGETENVKLGFNCYTEGQEITFAISAGENDLKVDSVTLVYDGALVAIDVINAIAALDREITAEDAQTVASVRTAYEALTDVEKGYVDNLNILEAAETTLNQMIADPVIDAIAALPEAITLDDESAVAAARASYDALTEAQQALVTNLSKLETIEANITAAKAVIDMIDALPEVDALTLENEMELLSAQAAYNTLNNAAKAMIPAASVDKLDDLAAQMSLLKSVSYGDINDDGDINASDALLALQHSVKLTTLKDNAFTAADVDESGVVDATDALYILQYSVKLINAFPAEK